MLAEASTPYTLKPRSIKVREIGMPVPHPRSRIVVPAGNNCDHSATMEAPAPDLFRPRLGMKIDAISS